MASLPGGSPNRAATTDGDGGSSAGAPSGSEEAFDHALSGRRVLDLLASFADLGAAAAAASTAAASTAASTAAAAAAASAIDDPSAATAGAPLPAGPGLTVTAVTALTLERIGPAVAVSITRLEGRNFQSIAVTGPPADEADQLQYALRSGPCVDAAVAEAMYVTQDLAHDERWPEYGRRAAAEHGVASMLSYRLASEVEGVIAALNVYSEEVGAFSNDDLVTGLLIATHGTAALALHASQQRSANLERALESSREIGVAMGILMATRRLSRSQAFDLLRITSQHHHRKLRDIAIEVGDTGEIPPLGH